jgi:glycosyltransferase involved in cell wall biosynthesis
LNASRVSVVIPTKNEEGLIGQIVESVRPYADEVLVIDGHSSDRTRDIAAARGARVELDGGKGKGEALRRSMTSATGDIVVFIDADGSHDPKDIPALVAPIKAGAADMVIGSRGKGGSDELHGTLEQFIRYVGSQLIMLAINYRWDVRLTDSQNGFRAVRRDVGLKLGLRANLTTIEQEMLMRALKLGYRVDEIPTH